MYVHLNNVLLDSLLLFEKILNQWCPAPVQVIQWFQHSLVISLFKDNPGLWERQLIELYLFFTRSLLNMDTPRFLDAVMNKAIHTMCLKKLLWTYTVIEYSDTLFIVVLYIFSAYTVYTIQISCLLSFD